MSELIQVNDAYGPTMAADLMLAKNVLSDIGTIYPGYLWNVDCNHEAGVLTVKLKVPKFDGGARETGFLLYISSVIGQDGVKKVRAAAGELLERHGLPRGPAPDDWVHLAVRHGIDKSHMILKSKA